MTWRPLLPSAPSGAGARTLPIYSETIFVDRSLGAAVVPDGLRATGLSVVTMRDYYGEAVGARVADVDWITMAAGQGWIMFHKDANIRRRADERQAVVDHAGRMFCITNANTTGQQNLDRYLGSLPAISRASTQRGPYIFGVDETKLRRLYP